MHPWRGGIGRAHVMQERIVRARVRHGTSSTRCRGASPRGASPRGASPRGASPSGASPRGASPGGASPGGASPGGASPGGASPRENHGERGAGGSPAVGESSNSVITVVLRFISVLKYGEFCGTGGRCFSSVSFGLPFARCPWGPIGGKVRTYNQVPHNQVPERVHGNHPNACATDASRVACPGTRTTAVSGKSPWRSTAA